MKDIRKTKAQLICELDVLRQRVATLEASGAEYKQEIEQLQANQTYYHHMVENGPGLICLHDLEGTILCSNLPLACALGHQPQEIAGQHLRSILAFSVRHLLDRYLKRIRQYSKAKGIVRVVAKCGEERVWAYRSVRYEEPGESPYVQAQALDITESVRTKQALKRREMQFRSLIEGSSQGIIIHRGYKPLFVNQTWADLHGYTTEQILSIDTILPLIAPQDQERLEQSFLSPIDGSETSSHDEYQAIRQDGTFIWLDHQITMVEWMGEAAAQSTVFDITERKRAEAALRESEERYRALVEQSLVGIYIIQKDRYSYVNPRFAKIFGYEPNVIMTQLRPGYEIIAEADREMVRENVRKRLDGEVDSMHYGFRGMRQDGTQVEVEVHGMATEYQGEPAVVGTMLDVTERKRAEAALRESEERYRALVEQSLAGIYIIQKGRYNYVNPGFAKIFGYEPDVIMTQLRPGYEIIAEADREMVRENVRKRLDGEVDTMRYGFRGVRQDGTQVEVEVHGMAIEYQGEPAVAMLDVTERKRAEAALQQAYDELELRVQDRTAALREANVQLQQQIVERERAEKALRQSEKRYRDLFENANDMVYTHTLAGDFTWINRAAERLMGYTRDEALQMNIGNLLTPEHLELSHRMRDKKVAGFAAATTYEVDLIVKAGRRVSLEVCTQFIFQDGKPVETLGIARDITERKCLEERLRQTQKMEAIGTLAGGIAHDFNNILYAMLGYTELSLNDLNRESPVWNNLHEVLTAGQRAKDLVQQILVFSRRSLPHPQSIQLTPLIQQTLKLLRGSLPSTITIRTHLSAASDTVSGDPTQLQQVLLNLGGNAEYAMRTTGGELGVQVESMLVTPDFAALHPNLQIGPHLRLIVRDTGIGMPPEVLDRIFEPFYTTKPTGEGTGLGLSVVHGIIISHGGVITVASAPGQGTAFEVYLPQTTGADPENEELPEMQVIRGNERILFVDDEEPITRLAHGMLKPLGYEVTMYTSSAEALAAFQASPERFDLVITDQTMPFMTGEVLACELRRIQPDIPIILCTGYSHLITAEKAAALGLDAFCLKPLLARDLARTIRDVMSQRCEQRKDAP